ncbi:MAG: hypothetical protein A4E72_00154 [Syntrophus sp. PtaU1.Bin208]|nr:MAG: hypothetical protein A4E72_00154 [Syntrophus sp. PtaU1.Bin208]
MDLQILLQRLQDADPTVRCETLRILAMVEETQALQAVAQIFKTDPDVHVRQTAQWAGRLLWQAHQRGHSTEQAIRQQYAAPPKPDHEEMLIAEVSSPIFTGKSKLDQKFLIERELQARQRELLDALHEKPADTEDVSLSDLAGGLLQDDSGPET